jgi:hypothetical protein
MFDPQNFIDRMLETENLTDALEDEDADYLLNWGVAQLKEQLGNIEDSETAGEYTNALMGFMRTVNQIAGNLESIQPEDLVQLGELQKKAFGPGQEPSMDAYGETAARLKLMTPHQSVEYLLQSFLKEE